MDQIYNYSKEIHNHIISKAFHPYLRRFLNEPVIEEKKLLLLILLLIEQDISDEERDQFITATMLVQSALDVHDDVTTTVINEETDKLKGRQLTVLTGDYYSGLYYYILSKLENINLIRYLAKGIKDINQQKIVLHQTDFADEQSVLQTVKVIESSLFVKVEEYFSSTNYRAFIENYLLLHRLQVENEKYKNTEESPIYKAFSFLLFSKDEKILTPPERTHLTTIVEQHTKTIFHACVNELKMLSTINTSLLTIFKTTLMEDGLKVNSFVEEG